MMAFKDLLREAMNSRGMRQIDLANRIEGMKLDKMFNVSKSQICCYLSGVYEPNLAKIKTLAKALDVSEAYLMGYDVPMERSDAQKKNDQIADLTVRLMNDDRFFDAVSTLDSLDESQLKTVLPMLKMLASK